MSVVVTGATGQLGRLIVESLLERGMPAADITAAGRSVGRLDDLAAKGVRVAAIDNEDPATLEAAFTGADVVVLVIDATTGVVGQDAKIAGFVDEAGKGLVVAFNKWDLIEKNDRTAGDFVRHAEEALPFARYAPVIHVSALSGQRVARILELAAEVADNSAMRVTTSRVNDTIMQAVDQRPPGGGRRSNILYATQTDVRPPTFVVFTSDVRAVDATYRRYLANQLRREYGFVGTPIRILVRKRR